MDSASTLTTRGRPRTFDEDEVLDATLDLFWRNGYRSTSIRDLEAALGVSQSSLYNAFGSKRGLLDAALDRYEARIDTELLRKLDDSDDGLAAIDRFLDALRHWVTHDGHRGCMIVNLMAEDGGESGEITERTRRYREEVRRALRERLERAAELGETPSDAITERAEIVFGIVLGLNVAARGGADDGEIDGLLVAAHGAVNAWRTSRPGV